MLAERGQALPGTYDRVLELLGTLRIKRILDAPSGIGILSERLKQIGYDVVALDLERGKYTPSDKKVLIADLTAGIPFRDKTFDAVICVEGIEHLYNSFALLKEMHRVLKPHGHLLLTTPNVVNWRSRIKFFLRGELFWFDHRAIDRFGHISPQLPFVLEYFLSKVGFTTLRVISNNRLSLPGLLAWILARPLNLFKRNKMNTMAYFSAGSLIYLCKRT